MRRKEIITHPMSVTYALTFLLALSILSLVSVIMNCQTEVVFIDVETGEIVEDATIYNQ